MRFAKESILDYKKIKLSKNKDRFIYGNVKGWQVKGKIKGNTHQVIGIDPGVNFGFVVIDKEDVYVYYGKANTRPKNERVEYSLDVKNLTEYIINILHGFYQRTCVVEGAAYGKRFGQVQLAEVRNGFFLGCRKYSNNVYVSPPATIRKVAFGGGNIHGPELFPTLNHNAADAIGVALMALDMENNHGNDNLSVL